MPTLFTYFPDNLFKRQGWREAEDVVESKRKEHQLKKRSLAAVKGWEKRKTKNR